MKKCKKCSGSFPDEGFPPYTVNGKSGRRGTCRKCWNEKWFPVVIRHQNRYYHENRNGLADKVKARSMKVYRENPQAQYERNKDYEKRHPEQAKARTAVLIAVRSGRLVRLPCSVCGATLVQAHHEDYSKPLDIKWLCRRHHMERHREINRSAPETDTELMIREFPSP